MLRGTWTWWVRRKTRAPLKTQWSFLISSNRSYYPSLIRILRMRYTCRWKAGSRYTIIPSETLLCTYNHTLSYSFSILKSNVVRYPILSWKSNRPKHRPPRVRIYPIRFRIFFPDRPHHTGRHGLIKPPLIPRGQQVDPSDEVAVR